MVEMRANLQPRISTAQTPRLAHLLRIRAEAPDSEPTDCERSRYSKRPRKKSTVPS